MTIMQTPESGDPDAGKTGTADGQDDASRLVWAGYVDYAGPEYGPEYGPEMPKKPELRVRVSASGCG
jgi:hypothetical protein